MKKMFIVAALVIGFAGFASAQVDGKAIGVRFGGVGEISYQHPLGDANRLELDLGVGNWAFGGVYLNGTYQWVKDLSALADGFNWYYGAGASLGINNGLGLGVLGQVGIEYHFGGIPLMASLDWRPVISLVPGIGLGWNGVALGVRYKF
jgi:hypothetical protein